MSVIIVDGSSRFLNILLMCYRNSLMEDTTLPMDDSPVNNSASPQNGLTQGDEATPASQEGRVSAGNAPGNASDWQKSYPTHKERFVYLLDSGINSDVILLVGKNEIPFKAHKLILSTGSPVFQNLLSGTHPAAEIFIPDVEPKPFRLLLNVSGSIVLLV